MYPLTCGECGQSVSRRGFVFVTLFLPFVLLIDLSGVRLPRLPSNVGSEDEENCAAHCQQDKCGGYEIQCMFLLRTSYGWTWVASTRLGVWRCMHMRGDRFSLPLSERSAIFHPSHHPVKYEEVKSCAWASKCWPVMGSITMFGLLFAFSNNRSRAWRG